MLDPRIQTSLQFNNKLGEILIKNLALKFGDDIYIKTEVEFKEFEPCLKFETRLNHGWFHLKLYLVFRD